LFGEVLKMAISYTQRPLLITQYRVLPHIYALNLQKLYQFLLNVKDDNHYACKTANIKNFRPRKFAKWALTCYSSPLSRVFVKRIKLFVHVSVSYVCNILYVAVAYELI
jgi:hypothetical protein